ncbi:MAG: hypothetical protein WBC82_11120, partial [Dehalococcoidia bacterium]
MAAIAGIVSTNGKCPQVTTEQLANMLKLMRHRGPDNTVVRTLPNNRGVLGAIEINLTPERTNCTAVASPPYILFDGELYNERTPGQSDMELFKQYYEKYRKDCFAHLEGSYTCAIVDEGETVLARDQVGARPLFFG